MSEIGEQVVRKNCALKVRTPLLYIGNNVDQKETIHGTDNSLIDQKRIANKLDLFIKGNLKIIFPLNLLICILIDQEVNSPLNKLVEISNQLDIKFSFPK